MTIPKQPTRPDGFDILLADHQNNTSHYDDHDAGLRHVCRPWSRLSPEGKLADADGHMRRWPELSAEGKVQHIARFTEAVHDALGDQPLRTDEMACLRLQFRYARQIRDPSPHPLPLAQSADLNHDISSALRDQLFSKDKPQPQPEHAHERQHKR